MIGKLSVTASRRNDPLNRLVDIYAYIKEEQGIGIAEPLVMKHTLYGDIETEGVVPQPLFSLDSTEAQVLMDGLWDCGLRPSEGTGSAGQLWSTQQHLEDMRRLVWRYTKA